MKHTQGRASVRPFKENNFQIWIKSENAAYSIAIVGGENKPNSEANAILIAEAFNVEVETGKSPAQLAQENKALVELNKELVEGIRKIVCLDGEYRDAEDRAGIALSLLTKAERINK